MNHRVRQLGVFAIAATIGLAVACDEDEDTTGPNVVRTNFNATLTGTAERPTPVTTNATGNVALVLFDDDSIQFIVRAATIDSVTAAHIHRGDANTAGPVLVFFGSSTSPFPSFTTLSTVYQGTITRTSTFTPATFTLDSLIALLNAGTSYANVHTRRNPGGEIRGQLLK